MLKKYLLKVPAKYLYLGTNVNMAVRNEDFRSLLTYIGKSIDPENPYPVGVAYREIKKETDKLLKIPFVPSFQEHHKLKTSKRQIRTILDYYDKKFINANNIILRIPYKISHIFEAIINIVERVREDHPVPSELISVLNCSYRNAFYSKHVEKYMQYYGHFRDKCFDNDDNFYITELYNDFFAEESPFQKIFEKKE